MNILNRIISVFVSKIKQTDYNIANEITGTDFFIFLINRSFMLLRGELIRLFFKTKNQHIFIGKGVKVRYKHKISFGRACTIKDYAYIEALSKKGVQLGNNVSIGKSAIIECTGVIRNLGEGLTIGDNSNIGDMNFIAVRGEIKIGNNVLIGPRVNMHAENHIFTDFNKPIKEQGESRKGIEIEDDVWIGAGSIILDGVKIGKGSIVAAGSVVNKSIDPYTIVGGVPIKVLKVRNK